MDHVYVELLMLLAGAVVGILFGPRARSGAATMVGELHQLVKAGYLQGHHVVDYVEAKIATERAASASMLRHADERVDAAAADAVDDAKAVEASVAATL